MARESGNLPLDPHFVWWIRIRALRLDLPFKTAIVVGLPRRTWARWRIPAIGSAAPARIFTPNRACNRAPVMALPMGAQLCVLAQDRGFAETAFGFVPLPHLTEQGAFLTDPAGVAMQFLGTPYLWGGNSRAGLDCSGLVQMSLRACGIDAPADSDLQQDLGAEVADDLKRNDLVFWRGHVAMVLDHDNLIHANGHTMSVAVEGILPCIARILAADGGPVTHRRRIG
jgi:cell wall-associated NlpC family hydrolase